MQDHYHLTRAHWHHISNHGLAIGTRLLFFYDDDDDDDDDEIVSS